MIDWDERQNAAIRLTSDAVTQPRVWHDHRSGFGHHQDRVESFTNKHEGFLELIGCDDFLIIHFQAFSREFSKRLCGSLPQTKQFQLPFTRVPVVPKAIVPFLNLGRDIF